jgi:hypothetical protein
MAQADGTYQCVAPSGVACVGLNDLDACVFTWGPNNVDGQCFSGACLARCTMAGNDCVNGNSVCQATGVIGAPGTGYVCIPNNQFTTDDS